MACSPTILQGFFRSTLFGCKSMDPGPSSPRGLRLLCSWVRTQTMTFGANTRIYINKLYEYTYTYTYTYTIYIYIYLFIYYNILHVIYSICYTNYIISYILYCIYHIIPIGFYYTFCIRLSLYIYIYMHT